MNNAEGKPNPGGASSEKVEIPEVDFENIEALERRYFELQQKIKDGGAEYEKAMQEDFKRLEEIKQSGAECDPKDLDKVNSILKKAKIVINGFRTKVEKINQIGYYGLLKEEEGHLKSEAANLEKETVSEAKDELSNVNERLSTISNEKNELITSKAGEIKQKRLDGKEPGYTWDEIDNTLSDQAIKPRTDEADKYMSNWDLKKAEEILEARADSNGKAKEPVAEGEKEAPDTGTEKPAVETGKGDKETDRGEKKEEVKEEEKKPEDIKSPEFKKFFQELTLEDFQNQDALKEKFKTIFTQEQFNTLKIDKSVQGSAVDRYFNNFIQSAEQYLQRQVTQQAAKAGEEHKTRGAITREIKKFGKGVFGGGLYAAASRGTNLALRIGTTSGLPIKILAGGVAGAAVSGFNWATGRMGEKLTGKNIQKLAKELAKNKERGQIEQNLKTTFDRDMAVLMTFDRDRDENLNTAQQELAGVEAAQLNSIFSSGNGEHKKKELIDLMQLTSKAKNLTGVDQSEAIETRQQKIMDLIDNKGLDEYVTHQITTLYKELSESGGKAPLIVFSRQQQEWIKKASIIVERELNSILGDVTAQEKFAEIDKKGKSFFERGYAAKLLGKEPPQSIVQAMWNGAISGAVASFATTDATTGAIYMAMQRLQGTLRSEILKHSEKIVKTADEIERDLIHTNVAELKEGQVRDVIRDARARIKLPDIKEIERAKIEAQVTRLENQLLKKDFFNELTQDSDLKIEALAYLAVGRRQEEIAEAASLAEKEKQSKSYWGLAKSFWQIGYTKKEGESKIKAVSKHLLNKEKAKILLKAGWEGAKGGAAGALGAELVGMGSVAVGIGNSEISINQSLNNIVNRATFGLAGGQEETGQKARQKLETEDQTVLDPEQVKILENKMYDLGVDLEVQGLLIEGVDDQDQILALQSRIQELSDNLSRSGASPEQIKALVSEADTPELLDQLCFVAENPSLANAGFKLDYSTQGVDATIELGKEGAPKHLEQAFCRLAMDQVDLKDGLTNVEGSQVLNIGANLRVLAQGHDVAGVAADDFDQYVDIVNGKVTINDYEGFKANVLEPLADHSEEIITEDNVADTGAVAYLDNITKETWHDMASPVGVADKINFDQSMIDQAEQALVAGDLKDSGLGEFVQDVEFANEANGTFKLFDQTVEVKGGQVVSIAGQKLEHPFAFGTKEGGDALMDRALDNKIAEMEAAKLPELHIRVSEGPTELKPILDIERIPNPAVQESEFNSMLRDAGLRDPGEIKWYLDKPTSNLLDKSLDPGSPDMGDPDWSKDASYDMDKLCRIISRAMDEKIIDPPAPGEKIEDTLNSIAIKYATHPEDQFVSETLDKCGLNRWERMIYSDEKVGDVMSGENLAREGAIRGPWESRDVGRLRDLIQEKANEGRLPDHLNSETVQNMTVEDLLKSIREKEMKQVPIETVAGATVEQPHVAVQIPAGAPDNIAEIKASMVAQGLDSEKYDFKEVAPGRIEATSKAAPIAETPASEQVKEAEDALKKVAEESLDRKTGQEYEVGDRGDHLEAKPKGAVQGGLEQEVAQKEQDRLEIHTAEEHYQRAFSKPFPEDLSQMDPSDLSRLESEVKEQASALQGVLAKSGLDAETQTEINNAIAGYEDKLVQIDHAQAEVPPTTTAAEKVAETPIAQDEIYAKLKQVGITFDEAGHLPAKIDAEWFKDNVNHMWTEKGELYVVTKGTSSDMQIAIDSAKQAARATAGSYGEASQGGDASDVYGIVRGVEDINRFVQQDRTGKYVAYVVSKAKL